MMRRFLLLVLAAASIAPIAWSQWHLEAVLNGASEVPPVPTAATGFGYFTLNRPANTITYRVSVTGVSGTGAHLHMALAGASNPAIFIALSGGPTVWEGTTAALTSADVVTLLTEGLYVNVHSAAFPGGEIRGQLIPVRRTSFTASLDGAQETPPNGSAATGFGRARLNEPEGRVIYDVQTTGLVSVTAAHIHVGAVGVPGAPLVPLSGGPSHFCGISQQLTAAEITSLKANGMYFNIHTAAFPGGEIRGQLIQSVQPFSVTVNGTDETPPNGSLATGCGKVTFNPATSMVSYSITTSPLPSGFLVAHFHTGAFGQIGGAFVTLAGGPTVFSGSAAFTAAQATNLFKGNVYVNVHSNAFPGGEIRGQVRPNPYIYGFGGEGTSGKPRVDAAGYNPPASTSVTLSLTNAFPSASVLLFISGNNTFSTVFAAPLPILIAPIGTLWIDADPGFVVPLTADATGCTELTIGVPALGCFRGYVQCVSTDPINGFNLVLSDALEFSILP